ncbi:pilus assembly protein [Phenylobacterium sp.]|uniref:pilus assembly protein n=1 Tax=Phenylobacterium sp. TaxID=1871053 RepID=UPI00273531E2|nr:pilus assembly protein [Phenylobacterium sp.]MDP3659412.1 pilus assembly protein [Phenylobacterium sp.]
MAHAVQQIANDGTREAVGGLDLAERQQLVRASVDDALPRYDLSPSKASWTLDNNPNRIVVAVTFDASQSPIFALRKLVPMPSSTIRRQAVVSVGGY